jgi:hypothetical protein
MDCLGVLNPDRPLNPLSGFPEITVRIENYISILNVQSIYSEKKRMCNQFFRCDNAQN